MHSRRWPKAVPDQVVPTAVASPMSIEAKPTRHELLRGPWQRLAVRDDGTLDKRAYTLGVLEQLRLALRRRDVFALGSERWSDPRRRLLEGAVWQQARPSVCHSLKLPSDAGQQLAHVAAQLDEAYRYVEQTVDPAVIPQAGRQRPPSPNRRLRPVQRPRPPAHQYPADHRALGRPPASRRVASPRDRQGVTDPARAARPRPPDKPRARPSRVRAYRKDIAPPRAARRRPLPARHDYPASKA